MLFWENMIEVMLQSSNQESSTTPCMCVLHSKMHTHKQHNTYPCFEDMHFHIGSWGDASIPLFLQRSVTNLVLVNFIALLQNPVVKVVWLVSIDVMPSSTDCLHKEKEQEGQWVIKIRMPYPKRP